MKYAFAALLFIHGAIHLLGFLKAFQFSKIEQLTLAISKPAGIFWLLAFVFFILAGIFFLLSVNFWFVVASAAIIISSILIVLSWTDSKFGTIANLIILIGVVFGLASWNFNNKYKSDVVKALKESSQTEDSLLTVKDLENLPEAVKKYIIYTGSVGKPKVKNFRVEFTGKIRQDEKSAWMPFSSKQYNFVDRSWRLFFMKAVMKKLPVDGYHCYKNGIAFMDIRLLSLIKVQFQEGKEMGIAETVTFFNDMCFMAPATLIDKRIKWLEADSSKVKAEFTNNNISIRAELFFNEKGELINFISQDRYAAGKDGKMRRLPWHTPAKDYKMIDGLRLSSSADAIYTYPEGELCYGTFNLQHIAYNCTEFEQ